MDKINKEMIRLYAAGYSMASIASQLNDEGANVTKNVVIGRISRMIAKGEIINRAAIKEDKIDTMRYSNVSHLMTTHSREMEDWNYPSNEKSVILLNLNNKSCRFPCSDGLFCGQDKQEHSSYCAEHHAIIYKPRTKRKSVV